MTIFTLDDVSATSNDETIQINNTDSVFGLLPGSMLFVGNTPPERVLSADDTARTLTLARPWPHASTINAKATVFALPNLSKFVDSINASTALQQAAQTQHANAAQHGKAVLVTASAVGASYTLSALTNTLYDLTLTQNVTISTTLRADAYAHDITLIIRQDAGGFSVDLAGVSWPGGVPTLSSSAGAVDVLRLTVTQSAVIGCVIGLGVV